MRSQLNLKKHRSQINKFQPYAIAFTTTKPKKRSLLNPKSTDRILILKKVIAVISSVCAAIGAIVLENDFLEEETCRRYRSHVIGIDRLNYKIFVCKSEKTTDFREVFL
jgi:hypothetical protein